MYKEIWDKLSAVNCSAKIEKKGRLSFLSWTWAWAELMKHYPEASYEFKEPAFFSDGSCEVWCQITIGECVRSMWLPVMDHKNNSEINPSSRKISDARMRCLTKCMAMFGLGHYIYAGEDLPEQQVNDQRESNIQRLKFFCLDNGMINSLGQKVLAAYKIQGLMDLSDENLEEAVSRCEKATQEKANG